MYWICNRRIIKTYDKIKLVPFVEMLPRFWRNYEWNKELFNNKYDFHRGDTCEPFNISDDFSIMPLICSELFFTEPGCLEDISHLFCFINDSWFIPTFRSWLLGYAKLLYLDYKKPILYVGHSDTRLIG